MIHESYGSKAHGLTTAASIWITAALAMVCGMGSWQIVGIALLFIIGRLLERRLHQRWLNKPVAEKDAIAQHEE